MTLEESVASKLTCWLVFSVQINKQAYYRAPSAQTGHEQVNKQRVMKNRAADISNFYL